MSLVEYADGLVRVAMGRLFWSFDRAMKADCLAIMLAIDGQADFLQGLFGSAEKAAPKLEDLPPLTPAALRGMFGR